MALAAGLFAISASAQTYQYKVASTKTAAADLTDGNYVLKVKTNAGTGYVSHYSACSAGRAFHAVATTLNETGNTDLTYVWKLVKTATDDGSFTFTLQNYSTSAYMPAQSERNKNFAAETTESNAAAFATEAISSPTLEEGAVFMYETNYTLDNNKMYIHTNTHTDNGSFGNLSYWNGATVGGTAVEFLFYAVSDIEQVQTVDVTYTFKNGEKTLGTVTDNGVVVGTTASVPSAPSLYSYYCTATIAEENKTISDDNKAFTVNVTRGETAAPFDANKIYTVKFRASETCYLVWGEGANIPTKQAAPTAWPAIKNGSWKLVESGVGVKIYSEGAKKYITLTSSASGTKATLSDEGTAFIVRSNSANNGTFCIQYPGVSNSIIGDHASSNLGAWVTTESTAIADGGSQWSITEVDFSTAKTAYTTYLNGLTAADQYDSDNNLQYVISASVISDAKTKVEAATDIATLYGVEVAGAFTPDADAYYQIIGKRNGTTYNNVAQTKYVISTETMKTSTEGALNTNYDGDSNRRILRNTSSDALVPQLWQFVPVEGGGYRIKNANTEHCFGSMSDYGSAIEMPTSDEWAGTYTLRLGQSQTYAMLCNNSHIVNAYSGEDSNILADWNGNSSADDGSNWLIKKITEVPVTINETAGYASVSFPFAVSLPTGDSELKAYYGTMAGDGVLKLTELEGTVIPAKTGVLLAKAGGGKVTLTITSDAGTTNDENKLVGVTAQRAGYESGDTYVLALNSQNQPAFLKSTLTVVPANKAYLPTTSISNAETSPSLSFTFGETTGIKALNATTGAKKYYDLNGRQVLYPTSGVYVTDGGEKVYIK